MRAPLSFQKAREGVTWPNGSSDLTVLADALYRVCRIFRIFEHLLKIVGDEHGMGKLLRDTPYSHEELTPILDAAENHPWKLGQAWVVRDHKKLRVATK